MAFQPGTLPLYSPLRGNGLWLLPSGADPADAASGAEPGSVRFFVPADEALARERGVVEEWVPVPASPTNGWPEGVHALCLALPDPGSPGWVRWIPGVGDAGAPSAGCRIVAVDPGRVPPESLAGLCRRFDRVRAGHRWVVNPGSGAGASTPGLESVDELLALWDRVDALGCESRWWEQTVHIMEKAGAAISFRVSAEGVIEYISPQIREFGFPAAEEVIGTPYARFVHPDDYLKLAENFSELKDHPERVVSFRVRNGDGEVFQLKSMSRLIEDPSGGVKLVGLLRDVSREERAVGMLERAGRLGSVLHQTSGVLFGAASMEDLASSVCRIIVEEEPFLFATVMELDLPGTVMGAWHRRSGQESRELLPRDFLEFLRNLPVTGTVVHPHLGAVPAFERFKPHLVSCQLSGLVMVPLFRPGRRFTGLLCVFAERPNAIEPEAERLLEELGRFLTHGILAIQDRQEMERVHDALAISEERYRHILENVQDVIFSFDAGSVLTFVGGNVKELFGVDAAALVGRRFVSMAGLFPDLDPGFFERYQRLFETAIAELRPSIEYEIPIHAAGRDQVLEVHERIHYNESGGLIGSTGVMRDISERRRALVQLERSEARYRTLFDLSAEGVFIETLEGDILECNEVAARMHGFTQEELLRLSAHNLVSEKTAASFEKVIGPELLRGGFFVEAEGRRKDGTIFPTEVSARLFHLEDRPLVMVTVRDMTERRRREAERSIVDKRLHESRRVESLSLLASKMAHDFNNLLVGILGNASLGLMDVSPDDPLRLNLQEIERAAEEAARLSRQLLAYTGGWKPHLVPVDLSSVLTRQAEVLQATFPERVRMIYRIEPSIRPVLADEEQCSALVSHVCSNSLDAIGDRAGMITVSLFGCETLSENPPFQLVPEGASDRGPFCCLEIADSGEGMEQAVLERIFDPCFSTKANAAGMGLVAVAGIVRSHNAVLQVSSLPGQGTVLRIFFPYCSTDAPLEQPQSPGMGSSAGGGRRILIIDDDLWVRNVAGRILSQAGCECLLAADGHKGLEAARALLPELDLVVLDLHLPGMPGNEVFRQLRQLRPELPVLISSGWSETLEPFWEEGVAPPAGYLPKPYHPSQLSDEVSRILGDPAR